MTRRAGRRAVLAVLCALWLAPHGARAIELGTLSVESTLGQRLLAEIEVVSTSTANADGVRVGLADPATYEKLGVMRPDLSSEIDIDLVETDGGKRVIRISSKDPVQELFLNLLLEVEDRDIQLIREVAILLDPSVMHTRPAQGVATNGDGSPAGTYVVAAGDSLMRIAQRFTPRSATPEQTAVAIHEANPSAFLGSIHRLTVGARLALPTAQAIRTYSARQARATIRQGIEDIRRRRSAAGPDDARTVARGDAPSLEGATPIGTAGAEPDGESPSTVDLFIHPPEDDLALQDFQAVVVNLQGNLYDLQGTIAERIAQLDTLNAQVDTLVDERVRIREEAERSAAQAVQARAAELAAALARADAAERALAASARDGTVLFATADESPADERAAAEASVPSTLEIADGEAPDIGESLPDIGERLARLERALLAGDEPDRTARVDAEAPLGPDAIDVPDSPFLAEAGLPGTGTAPTPVDDPRANAIIVDERPDTDRGSDDSPAEPAGASIDGPATVTTDSARGAEPAAGNEGAAVTGPGKVFDGFRQIAGTPLSDWSLPQKMQLLRDAGLGALALCMLYVLFSRRFRKAAVEATPEYAPAVDIDTDADIDYYLRHSTDDRAKEKLLKSVLSEHPRRQDIRLQLLELYAANGSSNLFGDEARIMYRMTRGNTPEWYRVVEMGLELDADIDFYKVVTMDDLFDSEIDLGLSDEDRVSSVPAGTHVGGGGRREGAEPIVSFEELMQLHNTVVQSEEGDQFAEGDAASGADEPDERDPLEFDAEWAEVSADDGGEPPLDGRYDAADVPVPMEERPVYVPEDDTELVAIAVNYTYGVDKLDLDLGDGPVRYVTQASDENDGGGDERGAEDVVVELDGGDGDEEEDPYDIAFTSESDFFGSVELVGADPETDEPTDDAVAADTGPGEAAAESTRSTSDDADGAVDAPRADFVAEFVDVDGIDPEPRTDDDILGADLESDEDRFVDLELRDESVEDQLLLAETCVDDGDDGRARALIDDLLPRAGTEQRARAEALLARLDESGAEGLSFG